MKTESKIALIAAGALGLMALSKKAIETAKAKTLMASGIGATKRRIWAEIEQAQKSGVDLTDPNGWERNKGVLDSIMNSNDSRPRASKSNKPEHQRYFNQLRRAYSSIAGTDLPFTESIVRNENDDVILVYRDYHLNELPKTAARWAFDRAMQIMSSDPVSAGYWATVAEIAAGKKFVWKGDKIHRGIEEMVFGKSAPNERKQRISYLASASKGASYIDAFAHQLWERGDMQANDMDILDGVLDAIRDVDSKGTAIEWCKQEYLKEHQVENPLLYQDVPF